MSERQSMQYDVLVVGAGPAGLAAAIRLKQRDSNLSVCLLEKGAEVGRHILSGAVIEPRALDELLPDWRAGDAPLGPEVRDDRVYWLGARRALRIPGLLVPPGMHNSGNRVASLGALCRWLGARAEALGVEIYAGFAADEVLFDDDGAVRGVATPDRGLAADGTPGPAHEPGLELHARATLFAEGARGHLGRGLMERFNLGGGGPQHYAIGLKEVWEINAARHSPGLVIHGMGWPLGLDTGGGSFLYHLDGGLAALGIIIDLNYGNPHLNPYNELQRLKHHPLFAGTLSGGRRIGYGARAIAKGGWNALPTMAMPGALLLGCNAGTLNFAKIKGTHTAMKSGMVAAGVVADALAAGHKDYSGFDRAFRECWAGRELRRTRNFGPALHRFGLPLGAAFNYLDQALFRGRLPITIKDAQPDHYSLRPAAKCAPINYPKPDGVLSFEKMESVALTGVHHAEGQPCHLQLHDAEVPVALNLPRYDAPEQRYCPAGVYEMVEGEDGAPRLQINSQNCIHCKTCDIKDPTQNIRWVAPAEGGGPAYTDM